ncbi:MAG: Protein TolB [Acidimicrobiales bacterium]|nr:MAG: hypothetical protein EDR02_09135 [Actinomycetota bacterium]MBV6509587.1 Protein TolB [Acidimicrobiales bacterium]RIK06551.1 MAG: hypothetical protein DCC48_06460 [Acidobacteriota bacterium]
MIVTPTPTEEVAGSDTGQASSRRARPRGWRRLWSWLVFWAFAGTAAILAWVFASAGIKGVVFAVFLILVGVALYVFRDFVRYWVFMPSDDVPPPRVDGWTYVLRQAMARKTLPFQGSAVVIAAFLSAVAALVATQLGLLWVIIALGLVSVLTLLVIVKNRTLFFLFAVSVSMCIILYKAISELTPNSYVPGVYITTLDVMLIVLYLIWIAEGTFAQDLKEGFQQKILWLPLLVMPLVFISALNAPSFTLVMGEFVRFLWMWALFVYMAVRIRRKEHIWALLLGWGVICLIEVLVTGSQYATGGFLGIGMFEVNFDPEARQSGRPFGTFIHPVFLATVQGMLAIMLGAFALHLRKGTVLRILALAFVPIALTPMFFSMTRAPLAVVSVPLIVLIVWAVRKQWLSIKVVLLVLLIGCVGLVVFNQQVAGVFGTNFSGGEFREQWDARWETNIVGYRMIKDEPLIGTGINNFQRHLMEYLENNLLFYGHPSHNFYILMTAESGFLGLFAVLIIGITFFVLAIRLSRVKDRFLASIGVGATVAFVYLTLEEMFSFSLKQDIPLAFYWVICGVVVACLKMAGEDGPTRAARRREALGSGDAGDGSSPRPQESAVGSVQVAVHPRAPAGPVSNRDRRPVPVGARAVSTGRDFGAHGRVRSWGERVTLGFDRFTDMLLAPIAASGRLIALVVRGTARVVAKGASRFMSWWGSGPVPVERPPEPSLAAGGGGRLSGIGRRFRGFGWKKPAAAGVVVAVLALASSVVAQSGPTNTDGMEMVFGATHKGTGQSGIYVADGNGGHLQRITPADGRRYEAPVWSHGGNKIVFSSGGGAAHEPLNLYLMNPDGSGVEQITDVDWQVRATDSLDGRRILAEADVPGVGQGVYEIDLDTLAIVPVTSGSSLSSDGGGSYEAGGGGIVFASQGEAVPSQLYRVGLDGTGLAPVAQGQYANIQPDVSAEGMTAYASFRGSDPLTADISEPSGSADWKVAVMDPETGEEKLLGDGRSPRWLANGDAVAYVGAAGGDGECICVAATDGSEVRSVLDVDDLVLGSFDVVTPVASPAGAVASVGASEAPLELLVSGVSSTGEPVLRAVSADGWRSIDYDTNGLVPQSADWSADGSRIVFTAEVPYDPGGFAPWPPPPQGQVRQTHLTMSTLGGLPVTNRYRPEVAEQQVFLWENGEVRQLTDPWIEDYMDGLPQGEARGNIDPVLSPDGRYVTFTNVSSVTNETFLLRYDIESGQVYSLTNATAGAQGVDDKTAAYSRDGSRLAFSWTEGGQNSIYTMSAGDGLDVAPVTNNQFTNLYPSWSPDGKSIVFVQYRGSIEEIDVNATTISELPLTDWYIVRVDLATGVEATLTGAGNAPVLSPTVSGDGSQMAYVGLSGVTTDILVMDTSDGSVRPLVSTPDVLETHVAWR